MVLMPVTAGYSLEKSSWEGNAATTARIRQGRRKERSAASHTAAAGVRQCLLTRAHVEDNGMPRSRAKAKIMREVEVTQERPQNHIASVTTQRTKWPKALPIACSKM